MHPLARIVILSFLSVASIAVLLTFAYPFTKKAEFAEPLSHHFDQE